MGERLYVECACGSPDHLLLFWRDPDEHWPSTLVSVQMDHTRPWWRRIVIATCYIFGQHPTKCHWADTSLEEADCARLAAFLTRSKDTPNAD